MCYSTLSQDNLSGYLCNFKVVYVFYKTLKSFLTLCNSKNKKRQTMLKFLSCDYLILSQDNLLGYSIYLLAKKDKKQKFHCDDVCFVLTRNNVKKDLKSFKKKYRSLKLH
jgi:hypothetical protein